MRKLLAGLTLATGSVFATFGAAGAQATDPCPESPQLCPPAVLDQPPIVREPSAPAPVPGDAPDVLGEGQVRDRERADDVQVEAAAPRSRSQVREQAAGGLPVTGADTVVLLASGTAMAAAGGVLLLRSKRAGAEAG